jgi:hypothetical protein
VLRFHHREFRLALCWARRYRALRVYTKTIAHVLRQQHLSHNHRDLCLRHCHSIQYLTWGFTKSYRSLHHNGSSADYCGACWQIEVVSGESRSSGTDSAAYASSTWDKLKGLPSSLALQEEMAPEAFAQLRSDFVARVVEMAEGLKDSDGSIRVQSSMLWVLARA